MNKLHCTDVYCEWVSCLQITIPQPLLPSSLKLPSRKPRIAFLLWARLSKRYHFSPSLCANVGPTVCFLVMFSADVFHETVDVRDRCGSSALPPWMKDSSNFSNRFFVLCSLGKFSIDPFTLHIAVSTQLHCRSSFARVHSDVFGTQIPGCLSLKPPFFIFLICFFLCSVGSFILFRMLVMKLYLSSGEFCSSLATIQSFLPAQHVAILSHTIPRLCHTHLRFHLVRFSGSSSIILACRDCHHLVLYFFTLFRESITAFVFSSHPHPMARHNAFRNFVKKKGNFI